MATPVSYGDRGPLVVQMQHYLKNKGFNPGAIDGIWGPKTQAAVDAFKKRGGSMPWSSLQKKAGSGGRTPAKPASKKPPTKKTSAKKTSYSEASWAKKVIAYNVALYGKSTLAKKYPWKLDPNSTENRLLARQLASGKLTWERFLRRAKGPGKSTTPTGPSLLPGPTKFTPPKVPEPDETLPPEAETDAPVDTRPNAKAELRRILDSAGLGELADIAWELYAQGIDDPEQLVFELESTEEFRARFPGIRNPDTGELYMAPGAYLEYERTIQSQLASMGFAPLKRYEIGALIQYGRSPAELREDLETIWDFQNDVYLRNEFFAYTGIDPQPEGLLALALGVAPDLQAEYDRAVEAGVSADEFFDRLGLAGKQDVLARWAKFKGAMSPTQFLYHYNKNHGTDFTADDLAGSEGLSLEDVTGALRPTGPIFRAPADIRGDRQARLRALQRAELAGKAQFQAGGRMLVEDRLREETF